MAGRNKLADDMRSLAESRKRRSSFRPLPQIGSNTDQCKPVEDLFNALGLRGQLLINITAFGQNGRSASAAFTETAHRWQYKVVQFNMKDPLVAENQLNRFGDEGWILHQVYSQGANNFATAAVLIRPAGKLSEETGMEHTVDDSEPSIVNEYEEAIGTNVSQESLKTVGT